MAPFTRADTCGFANTSRKPPPFPITSSVSYISSAERRPRSRKTSCMCLRLARRRLDEMYARRRIMQYNAVCRSRAHRHRGSLDAPLPGFFAAPEAGPPT
eukprot:10080986-Karenia_brevis.AAC.1